MRLGFIVAIVLAAFPVSGAWMNRRQSHGPAVPVSTVFLGQWESITQTVIFQPDNVLRYYANDPHPKHWYRTTFSPRIECPWRGGVAQTLELRGRQNGEEALELTFVWVSSDNRRLILAPLAGDTLDLGKAVYYCRKPAPPQEFEAMVTEYQQWRRDH